MATQMIAKYCLARRRLKLACLIGYQGVKPHNGIAQNKVHASVRLAEKVKSDRI